MKNNITLDFFYGNEAEQFNFYRIPKALFTDERFAKISVEAKVLYGLMLDRLCLSVKNGWIDEENRVYIYFKLEEVTECLNFGKDKCVKLFSELDGENGIGLIKRKKQGLGKPTIIYVMNFSSDTAEVKTSENPTSRVRHSTEVLTSTKPKSALPENRSQEVGKSDSNNTEINNTDFNYTESILSDPMQDMMDRSLYGATIKKNIEYDSLIKTHKKEDIDGLLNIMLDVVCSKKPYLIISNEKTPTVIVTERMLRVRAKHIEYVMDSLKSNTTKVKNIKSYLLTMLYNSVSTIGHYYRAEASYDLNGGRL